MRSKDDIALSLTSNMVHQMNDGHGREDKPMGNEIVDPTSPPVMLLAQSRCRNHSVFTSKEEERQGECVEGMHK